MPAESHRHVDAPALARAVVNDIEQTELAPAPEGVVHEIQRPALTGPAVYFEQFTTGGLLG